jgi:hypothetical protein
MLTFLDRWVLFPAGYHDYFMRAREKEDIAISEYINMIESAGIGQEHKPFYSTMNYFYDIRKRIDKFFNSVSMRDLYSGIPDCGIRLIDAIMEAQNYIIHYLTGLYMALSGEIQDIEAYRHGHECFNEM